MTNDAIPTATAAVEPVADLIERTLDDLEDLAGLAREYDYYKANPLQERIAASLSQLSQERDELRAKLAEARETAFEEAAQIAEHALDRFGNWQDGDEIATAIRARAVKGAGQS